MRNISTMAPTTVTSAILANGSERWRGRDTLPAWRAHRKNWVICPKLALRSENRRVEVGSLFLLTAVHPAHFEGPEQSLSIFVPSARYPSARIIEMEVAREAKFFAQ